MTEWIDRRRAGILLHITSLPGPFSNGVIGEESRAFVDAIREAGFSVWQFLPLGPTHGHGSPYETLSAAAGNPELLDLRDCVARGWLTEATLQQLLAGGIDAAAARAEAAAGFWRHTETSSPLRQAVEAFLQQSCDWLDDYAVFAAFKRRNGDLPWWGWPEALRDRLPEALEATREQLADDIRQIHFEQFLFAEQWQALKTYAEARGVLLFGDLPIYVAHDSSDVWAHRRFFTVNEAGLCDEVAGVPPDYFSDSGQRWGNPLYRWDVLQDDGFDWWVRRVRRQLSRTHLLRIDHFRGLEAYWAIPGERQDGRVGEWRKAPGRELLEQLHMELGKVPFVAEDLGLITREVTALREAFDLPGMKILQFAFGDGSENPYLPHNHEPNSVVYTGTHDNDTTLGWFRSLALATRDHLRRYLRETDANMPWPLVRSALASVSVLAVIPMQDILSLGSECRLNTPATLDGNWQWRLPSMQIDPETVAYLQSLNTLYGRSIPDA